LIFDRAVSLVYFLGGLPIGWMILGASVESTVSPVDFPDIQECSPAWVGICAGATAWTGCLLSLGFMLAVPGGVLAVVGKKARPGSALRRWGPVPGAVFRSAARGFSFAVLPFFVLAVAVKAAGVVFVIVYSRVGGLLDVG
jgi:hypothetical protein